jgi:hypothetical protein
VNEVREYVEHFKSWRSGANIGKPVSPEVYENNLCIKIPMKDWLQLGNDLNIFETDEKYPKYSYYSSLSTLIVEFMPFPVHESITNIFICGFIAAQQSLTVPLRRRITLSFSQDYNGFEGKYSGSNKTPNLAVEFADSEDNLVSKFILEAGFSKSYSDLTNDAKLWLEGTRHVSTVVLAKFDESPKYRSPVNVEDLRETDFSQTNELVRSDFTLIGEYGPAMYKGMKWAGEFSAAYMEIWTRDPGTGLAVKHGARIDLLAPNPPQLKFKLSDFLNVSPEADRPIHFPWDDYKYLFQKKIRQLAMYRCRQMLNYLARQEDLKNPDYSP